MSEGLEIIPAEERAQLATQAEAPLSQTDPYIGAASLKLTDREKAALTHPLAPDEIKEFPANAGSMAGLLYVDHVAIRRRLNDAFGPGSWSLVPAAPPLKEATYVAQPWRLYVLGAFVAEGWGEQEFRLGSNTLSFPTALEGAKSTALMRCAKDLGIGLELWDKAFVAKFKASQKAAGSPNVHSPIATPAPPGDRASQANVVEKTPLRADPPAAIYMISEVIEKHSPPEAARPWTLFLVKTRDGKTFGTFDRKHAEDARNAAELDLPCRIAHTLTAKGNTQITALIVVEEHPDPPMQPVPDDVQAVADAFDEAEILLTPPTEKKSRAKR